MAAPAGRQPGPGASVRWRSAAPRDDRHPSGVRLRTPVLVLASEEGAAGRPSPDGQGWEALTPRELEVVALVTLGATNQQAARRLSLSPHTVNAHLRHVYTKLGVSSRVELTRVAVAREHHASPPRPTGPPPDRIPLPVPRTPHGTRRGTSGR